MPLIVKENKEVEFELISEWIHIAKCIGIIDLWTQEVEYKWEKKEKHQVRIEFELLNETYEYIDKETNEKKENTRNISKTFWLSLHKKSTLRSFLESWRWKKFTPEELEWFDLEKLLWVVCQLQVMHSDDWKFANIQNLLPVVKWTKIPESKKEPKILTFERDEKWIIIWYDDRLYDLSEYLQKLIYSSKELNLEFPTEEKNKKDVENEKNKVVSEKDVENIF